jgi:hypothetical protein
LGFGLTRRRPPCTGRGSAAGLSQDWVRGGRGQSTPRVARDGSLMPARDRDQRDRSLARRRDNRGTHGTAQDVHRTGVPCTNDHDGVWREVCVLRKRRCVSRVPGGSLDFPELNVLEGGAGMGRLAAAAALAEGLERGLVAALGGGLGARFQMPQTTENPMSPTNKSKGRFPRHPEGKTRLITRLGGRGATGVPLRRQCDTLVMHAGWDTPHTRGRTHHTYA